MNPSKEIKSNAAISFADSMTEMIRLLDFAKWAKEVYPDVFNEYAALEKVKGDL